MLSRVADSLYWMSRYLERAENTARQLDVTMNLMLDVTATSTEARGQRLMASLGQVGQENAQWHGDVGDMARRLVFDAMNPASITSCINAARENARQVREEISTELWQLLNRLYHHMHSPEAQAQFGASVNDFLASVLDGVHLFKGVGDSTMIHGEGWQFIRLGRYLERSYATATLLEVYHAEKIFSLPETERSGYQYLELVGLLRCSTAFEAYCQVYTADIQPERILEFLLLNAEFPHSLRYCIDGLRNGLEAIQAASGRKLPDEMNQMTGKLQSLLDYATIGEILEQDLGAWLRDVRSRCLRIHELIYRYYVQYSIQSALAV